MANTNFANRTQIKAVVLFQSFFLCIFWFGIEEGFGDTKTKPTFDKRKSNIVIIVADDLGYRDLSCYGCEDFTTPNIDQLAKQGIRLTNGYVSHPYCSPSRAGLLSGKYQQSFGHEHNPIYDESNTKIGIDKDTTLLPGLLSREGYQTGLVGKWHLGAGNPFRPVTRGFDEFYGFLGGGHHYFRVVPDGKNYDSPMWRNNEATDDTLTYLTDDLTKQAEDFIVRCREKPFCLFVMYNAPHSPDHVTKNYEEKVASIEHAGRRRYAALIQGVDEGVRRISAKLAQHELTENTLVVFLSDNGGRRDVSDNRPLRGNKGWLHEGGIRVPFILSLPGTLPKDEVFDGQSLAIDLMPTALGLADIKIPKDVDGVDLFPYLTGKQKGIPHEKMFWRVSGGEGIAMRHLNWKLVRDIGMARPELFDLSVDPGENKNLAANNANRVEQMMTEYKDWSETLETPRWTEGHTKNTLNERAAAKKAGTRQFPMSWVKRP